MPVPAEYAIRLARREEIPLLAPLQLAAAKRFSTDDLPEPLRSTYTVPREYLEEAFARGALWVGARPDGNPVGYAVLREAEGLAFLFQVDVLPEYGRKGLGGALIERVISRARELDYGELYLTTFGHVPWNAPFYAKLGFTILRDGEMPAYVRSMLREERALAANRVAMRKALR